MRRDLWQAACTVWKGEGVCTCTVIQRKAAHMEAEDLWLAVLDDLEIQ